MAYIPRFTDLLCLLIALQLSCAYGDVDVKNLSRDLKTGLLSYTPDLSVMSEDEIDKFRDVIIYNEGHERFCKVKGLPDGFFTKHWHTSNWCRKVISPGNGWNGVKYEDLCCEGHGSCVCKLKSYHCSCGH